MDELWYYFGGPQILAFFVWLVFVLAMMRRGLLRSHLGVTCLVSVASMVGYILLITIGVLGAGFSKGLIFPGFDAFIEPFLVFFFGIPAIVLVILVQYGWKVWGDRRFDIVVAAFTALSIYILWVCWAVHVDVIGSV